MNTDESQIEVIIEYDKFIAGRELAEIIEVLDEAVWYEMEDKFLQPPFRYRYSYFRRFDEPPPSLFCVTEVSRGSMLLTGIIGGATAKYCYDRFRKGFRRSRFGDQIEIMGQIIGDNLSGFIESMNRWLEEYTADAREKRSNIKSIKARRKKSHDKEA